MLRHCVRGEGKKRCAMHDNVLIEQHKNNLFTQLHKKKDISY